MQLGKPLDPHGKRGCGVGLLLLVDVYNIALVRLLYDDWNPIRVFLADARCLRLALLWIPQGRTSAMTPESSEWHSWQWRTEVVLLLKLHFCCCRYGVSVAS